MEKLNNLFQAAAQEMYQQGGAEGAAGADPSQGPAGDGVDEEVTDVDFEEVNEDDNASK